MKNSTFMISKKVRRQSSSETLVGLQKVSVASEIPVELENKESLMSEVLDEEMSSHNTSQHTTTLEANESTLSKIRNLELKSHQQQSSTATNEQRKTKLKKSKSIASEISVAKSKSNTPNKVRRQASVCELRYTKLNRTESKASEISVKSKANPLNKGIIIRNGMRCRRMDDPNRIRVYLRMKPGNEGGPELYQIAADEKQLNVVNLLGHVDRDKWFTFDHIFNDKDSNKEVFKRSGQKLVDDILKGFNCSLFAYGQTGSGKTHTLMASDGLTAYMVSRLFSKTLRDPYHTYKVTCSYLQIYQEKIYDLLNSNQNLEYRLREDPQRGIYVENISTYACYSPNDVYELLNLGRKRLIFAETKMNRFSSRSHAVCQITVEKQIKVPSELDMDVSINDSSSPRSRSSSTQEVPYVIVEPPASEVDAKATVQSPPLPFRKPVLRKSKSNICRTDFVMKSEVADAPPCNLSVVRSSSDADFRENSCPSQSPLTYWNKKQEFQTATVIKNPSMLPVRISADNFNKNRCSDKSSFKNGNNITNEYYNSRDKNFKNKSKNSRSLTPDPSIRRQYPGFRDSSSPNPQDTYSKPRSLSSYSIEKSAIPVNKHSRPLFCGSSNECIVDNFVMSDDPQWIMRKSCLDMSKLDDDEDQSSDSISFDLDSKPETIYLKGKLSIVDLAGSERAKRTKVDDQQLKEAKHISVSLHELANVIAALSENRNHIPYRNSKLTRLLQDSLGGNCKTSFVLCISPTPEDFVESQSTLHFGQRLLKLTTKPNINVEPDYKLLVEELKATMKSNEMNFEQKIREYEEKLHILKSEKNKADAELYQQNTISRYLRDQCNTSNSKHEDTQLQLQSLRKKLRESENTVRDRERQVELLSLENKRLLEENEEIYQSKLNFERLYDAYKKQDWCDVTHTFDVGVNTERETIIEDLNNVLDKRNKELADLSKEYKNLLEENETLRQTHFSRRSTKDQSTYTSWGTKDQETSTLPWSTKNRSTNTIPVKQSDASTNTLPSPQRTPTEHELERMRHFLLAEVMSLQLLYSMFDLKTKSQVERDSILHGVPRVNGKTYDQRENGATNSSLSTPSGYETESHSQLDIDKRSLPDTTANEKSSFVATMSSDNINKSRSMEYFNFLSNSPVKTSSLEGSVPKTGNLLEEILEAQKTGSCLLPGASSVKDIPIESRVAFLRNEIGQQKKLIENELTSAITEHLGIPEAQGVRVHKREVYSSLVQKLSEEDFTKYCSLDSLEQILNLVLVDHSLTGCLLALSHKTKQSTLNMIRRLSNYKSTNQKPLLDYSYIDQDLYGYDNEACVAFHSDDNEDGHIEENVVDYNKRDDSPAVVETDHSHSRNLVGGLALDSDNEGCSSSSDSEVESPVTRKKGLRRFLCMPVRSKTLKPTSFSVTNTMRRSFRRPKKKDPSLMDFEQ